MRILYFTIIFISTQTYASKAYYPEEFSDFFDITLKNIEVGIAGDREAVQLPALVNFDTFKLEAGSRGEEALSYYLYAKGLKVKSVDEILLSSEQGIHSDVACIGRMDKCVLSVEDGELRYVFDFDRAKLTIFVPPQHLKDISTDAEYESAFNLSHNAMINWSRLYVTSHGHGDESLSWSNESLLGLPIGAILLDTQYSSSIDDFTIYKAIYDSTISGYRFKAGSSKSALSFNTTDYLNSGTSLSMYGIFFGSSANLLKGKSTERQRIYFYAPQSGQLEIYRNDRLIFTRVLSEGRHHISYSDLPTGVYDIHLELKVAGEVVVSEDRLIVNNQIFSLPVGEWDYVIGGGRFKNDDRGDEYDTSAAFFRAMLNYRISENLMLGGVTTVHNNEQQLQLGGQYYFNDFFGLTYNAEVFTGGSTYQYAFINAGPIYIDYRHFYNKSLYSDGLANYMYGQSGFSDVGVGLTGNLSNKSSGYLSYQLYQRQDLVGTRHYISGGISTPILGGDLMLSSGYTIEPDGNEEMRIDLNWSLQLNSNWSAYVRLSTNENGFSNNSNYLKINGHTDRWSASASLGTTVSKDYYGNHKFSRDVSGTLNGHNDNVNLYAYAHTNNKGPRTFSATLSGTQMVSGSGIDFSYEKARSFAKIITEIDDVDSEESINRSVQYSVIRDGDYQRRGYIQKKNTLIKVNEYSQLSLKVDDAGYNVALEGDSLDVFVHPGSLYELNTHVIPVRTRLVVLDDIFGDPITQAQCIGAGCVSVEPLSSDGVFRVRYKDSTPYQIVSRKGLCLTEALPMIGASKGFCMPGIDGSYASFSWKKSELLLDNALDNQILVYLGRFNIDAELGFMTDRLNALELKYKAVYLDKFAYIYLADNHFFNSQQRAFLEELDAHVMLQDESFDLLTFTSMWSENHGHL